MTASVDRSRRFAGGVLAVIAHPTGPRLSAVPVPLIGTGLALGDVPAQPTRCSSEATSWIARSAGSVAQPRAWGHDLGDIRSPRRDGHPLALVGAQLQRSGLILGIHQARHCPPDRSTSETTN